VGSAKLLLTAAVVGIPVGFLGGVYPAEYGRGALASWVRYAADVLNGIPSIVIGITVYTLVVIPIGHFSTLAGGVALGVMMVPVALRSTEEFLRLVPDSLREAALALGAPRSSARIRRRRRPTPRSRSPCATWSSTTAAPARSTPYRSTSRRTA